LLMSVVGSALHAASGQNKYTDSFKKQMLVFIILVIRIE